MLTDKQIAELRPYGWDLRTNLVAYEGIGPVTIPAWTTVVTVDEVGDLYWPVTTATTRVAILTGERKGETYAVRTSTLSRALGHS